MRPTQCRAKLLTVLGACWWIGSMVGCGGKDAIGSGAGGGGAVSAGGIVGSGGSGGDMAPDAMVGTGGAYGGAGGAVASGGRTGSGGAFAVDGGGGTTGTGPATDYVGCFWAGGLDHVTLQRRDFARDQCILLDLASPTSSRSGYEVSLPTRWGLVSASISPCTGTGTAVLATSATGTISWGPETSYPPETANVDVVLGVTVVDGGPTFTYVFSAQDIELASGC